MLNFINLWSEFYLQSSTAKLAFFLSLKWCEYAKSLPDDTLDEAYVLILDVICRAFEAVLRRKTYALVAL